MEARPVLVRRLRLSGGLLGAGLLVEAITLVGIHPMAFMAFLGLGAGLVAAGVLLYLYAILSG